jgi:hypothetical protein
MTEQFEEAAVEADDEAAPVVVEDAPAGQRHKTNYGTVPAVPAPLPVERKVARRG